MKPNTEEKAALERGEVLTRLLRDGGGHGVEATGLIEHPPADVYRVVTDYDRYSEFIPSVVDARVLEWESDDVCILMEKVKIAFKTVELHLRIRHDRKRFTTEWTKHDGFLERSDGGWTCAAYGKGRSLVTYRVDIETGMLIPQFVVDRVTRGSLPDLFEAVRLRLAFNKNHR